MLVYLIVKDTKIIGYSRSAVEGSIEYTIEDPATIKLGIDEYINGEIVAGDEPIAVVKQRRILELKKMLADTDYLAIKFFEGELSAEDFAETKALRHSWREEINQLEK